MKTPEISGIKRRGRPVAPIPVPAFAQQFVLWEVIFKQDVPDICDLTFPNAPAFFQVFPSLMRNPSQDYYHLKQCRADIQSDKYRGIRAPSSRSTQNGNTVVLFGDQSRNVRCITPFVVNFRLMSTANTHFVNHAVDLLDFTAGEVRIVGTPSGATTYANFVRVPFNH